MPGGERVPQVDTAARVVKEPLAAAHERPLRPRRALAGTGKVKHTPSRSASPVSTGRGGWERGADDVRVRKELPPVSAHECPARLLAPGGTRKIKHTPPRSASPAAEEEGKWLFERTRSHSASPPRQRHPRLLPRVSFVARLSTSSLGHHRGRHHRELDSSLTLSLARLAWDKHSRSEPSLTKLMQPTTRPGGIRLVKKFSDPLPTESVREGDLAGILGDELKDRLARKMEEVEAQRAADQEDTVTQKPRRRIVTTASPGSQRAAQASQLLKLSHSQQSRSPVEPKVAQRRRSVIEQRVKCDRVKDALLRKVERQTNQCFREMFAGLPEDELDVEIHRVFYSFDSDGNMRLDKDEFVHAFDVMGLRLSSEQLDATFKEMDHNDNGTIEADEFCRMVRERDVRECGCVQI